MGIRWHLSRNKRVFFYAVDIRRAAYAVKESALVFFLLTRSNPSHTNLLELHIYDHIIAENDCRKFRSNRIVFQKAEKSRKWLFFYHFRVNFGYVSFPSHTDLMNLHSKDHNMVYNDCVKFRSCGQFLRNY